VAQGPFKVDQLQIEPGQTGARLFNRNSTDGSIQFSDTIVTTPTSLHQLAGFKAMSQVFTVGKSGLGSAYTTIQSAIDAVNGATTSAANPALILIGPGVYQEDVSITKDGVHLFGLGMPTIQSAHEDTPGTNPSNTVTIQSAGTYVPKQCILQNLIILNSHPPSGDNGACVRVTQGGGSLPAKVGLVETAAGLTQGTGGIRIINCNLFARGAGGYQIRADAINTLLVYGGDWSGSHAISGVLLEEVADFYAGQVDWMGNLQLDYDSGAATLPETVGSAYFLNGCSRIGSIASTLSGQGSLGIYSCPVVGTVGFSGDRALTARGSQIGNLTAGAGTSTYLYNTTRGAVAAGGGKVNESRYRGMVAFAGDTSKAVTLPWERVDATYTVTLDLDDQPAAGKWPAINGKAATGFTINFGAAQTLNVSYVIEAA